MSKLKENLYSISIIILIMAALFGISSRSFVDPDLWGHLRFGLDTIEAGHIIQEDPYSYLSLDQRWINHEWLAEVAFGFAWLISHVQGLVLLKTVVALLTTGMIYFFLVHRHVAPLMAGILVFLAWFGIQPALGTIRPHMFTILFTAVLFIIISSAEIGKYRWLWILPVVFALWVNFHGGFLAGLAFLGIWSIIHLIFNSNKWPRIVPPVALSFLAVLLNPYGLDLITFLIRTATVSRPEIIEWMPIGLTTNLGIIYLVLLTLAILGVVFSNQKKSLPLMVVLSVSAVSPLISVRHLPLFALAVVIFAGVHIANARNRLRSENEAPQKKHPLVAALSLSIAVVFIIWGYTNLQHIQVVNESITPVPIEAVSLLNESDIEGNLAVEFNWGEYVIWHLGPEVQISVDGRRETIYSDEIYRMNLDFVEGINDWDKLLDDHETHMALVSRFRASRNLLILKDGWELVYEDGTSALFASSEWDGFNTLKNAQTSFSDLTANNYFP